MADKLLPPLDPEDLRDPRLHPSADDIELLPRLPDRRPSLTATREGPRPADPLTPVYENLSPALMGYGLGHETATIGKDLLDENYGDAAKGTAGLILGAMVPGPGPKFARPMGNAAIRSGRGLAMEEAALAAEKGTHLKRKPSDGKYVGAPEHVNSPQSLGALRGDLYERASTEPEGGSWYHKAQDANREITGGDAALGDLHARELAITSPLATPETNLGFALQGHNSAVLGAPREIVRDRAKAGQVNKAVSDYLAETYGGDVGGLGKKTSPYGDAINPHKESYNSVNDTIMARSFGFANPDGTPFSGTVTPQMHAFMDGEMSRLTARMNQESVGGRNDWTPHDVQASIWVTTKARQFMEKNPKLSFEEAFAEANKGYGDYLQKHTAYDTHESAPYATSGHLEGYKDLSPEARASFENDPRSSWAGPDGRDSIYGALEMYARPTQQAQGAYAGPYGMEYNRVDVARPLVDLDSGPRGHEIPGITKDALSAASALRGLVDVQGGAAWNKPITKTRAQDANAAWAPKEGKLSREELQQANEQAGKYDMAAIDNGEGVLAFDPSFTKSSADILAAYKDGLGEKLVPGQKAERARMEGDYTSYESELRAANAGKGLATQKMLERFDRLKPEVQDRIARDPDLMAAVAARIERDQEFAARHGLPQRADVRTLREAMTQPGWHQRLREMLADGVPLPAMAAGILGAEAVRGRGED